MFSKLMTAIALTLLLTPIKGQANLVNTLRAISLCSEALNTPEGQLLDINIKNIDPGKIDCLTLQNYFSIIDNHSNYRSFDRARSLVNAQRIVNVLAKYSPNSQQDVSRLQTQLDNAFQVNLRALKQLTRVSVLEQFGKTLRRDEKIFFFGVQPMEEGLYVLEGRKSATQANFEGHVIKPKSRRSFPTIPLPLALRVDERYLRVSEIQQPLTGRAHGFYISNLRIIIPPPREASISNLSMMGHEIAAMLNIPVSQHPTRDPDALVPLTSFVSVGDSSRSDTALAHGMGSHSDSTSETSTTGTDIDSASTGRTHNSYPSKCKNADTHSTNSYEVVNKDGLTLRSGPSTETKPVTYLKQGNLVYPLMNPETGTILKKDFWMCVKMTDGKKGWISSKSKYLQPTSR